ncbi:helix-turn-helix domain-containing protein [Actinomadura rudentiformis]|uniref:Helix-turn-helix transcriptional regulator n=1 Tax=Actinomadura rudentiformis TaxID=359158 RepID=A0A6H9YUF7_9ACTN|nr:helix-turn-helix transcriptional regulator [Actinomadura rudentiformis]KAB2347286.1 helix-turn-helix transcriptional regulator [Actinomadura rudentiformis]
MEHTTGLAEGVDPEAYRIGQKLRNIRKFHDFSLQDLGERLGRTHSSLSKIENGLTRPERTYQLIGPLADIYGIPAKDIVKALYPPDGPHPVPPELLLSAHVADVAEES